MCKFHECSSNFILFLFFNLYHLFLSLLAFIPTGPILSSETPASQVRDCQGPSAACIDLSPLYILDSFIVNYLTIYVCGGLFPGSLSCSIDLCVYFYANTILFDYYSFVIQFEIRKCDASNFVLLSQDCFGYFWSLLVPYKF